MPTPEMYFDYAESFTYLGLRSAQLMPPAMARLNPEVIRGGVLTDEVTATLITNERAAALVAEECDHSASECRRRGVQCAQLRQEWRSYERAMESYGVAVRRAAAADPPGPTPPPPVPPPAPPSWCQF